MRDIIFLRIRVTLVIVDLHFDAKLYFFTTHFQVKTNGINGNCSSGHISYMLICLFAILLRYFAYDNFEIPVLLQNLRNDHYPKFLMNVCIFFFFQILAWVCRGPVWNILLPMVTVCVMRNNVQCLICDNSQCVLGDAG